MGEVAGVAGRHFANVSCLKGNEDLKYEVLRNF
jgi:hypothetical protein